MSPEKKTAKKEAKPKAAPAKKAESDSVVARGKRRRVEGVVVSDKMQKTIVVKVVRQVKHGLYFKYVEKARRFKAHDEKNDAKMGDLVSLVETRPLSRDKRWALVSVIRRAGQAPEANV